MAALGSLVVKLGLDFAQYTGGLDKSEQASLAASKRIQDTFDSMKSKMAATAGAIAGGLAAGFTINAFKGLLSGAIETGAALDDLRMQTGSTVEALSGLVAIGKFNNMGPEAIGGAMNKLAANLAGATEESKGTGKALEALGIDFSTFKNLRPEDQMQTVAKAMAKFEDGTGKAAVAMALYGKQGAAMLPFLSDLAEAETLTAKTSTAQAAAAASLDDNLTRLTTSGDAWKKELAQGMIPALDLGAKAMLGVMNGTGGIRDEVRKLVADGSVERWTKSAINGLTYAADAAEYLWRGIKMLGEGMGAWAAAGVSYFVGMGEAIKKVITGDYSGAVESIRSGVSGAKSIMADLGATTVQTFGENTMGARIRARMGEIEATGNVAEAAKSKIDFTNVLAKNTKAAKEAKNPLDALLDSIDKRIAVGREELSMGEKLTDGEKLAAEVNLKVKNSKDAQILAGKGLIETKLQEMLSTEKSVTAHRLEIKTLDEARQARAKLVQSMEQSVGSMQSGNDSLREEIELIGLTEEQQLRIIQRRNDITIATKQATLAELQRASAVTGTQTREEIALEAEIELLKERNGLLGAKFDRSVAAQQSQQFNDELMRNNQDLRRGLGDAIETAITQGGKAGGKKLRDVLQEALKKPFRVWLDSAINSLFGLGGSASGSAGGGASGLLGMVSNVAGLFSAGKSIFTLGSQWLSGSMSAANVAGTVYANAAGTGLNGLLATNGAFGTSATSAVNAAAAMAPGAAPALPAGTLAAAAAESGAAGAAAPSMIAGALKMVPIIGAIVMGMMASGSAYDQGYRLQDSTIKKTYGLIFPHLNKLTDAFVKMGFSERTANVITGGALIGKIASKLGIQSTMHSGAGAIVQNGKAQEGKDLYTLANFGMGDPREYNKDAQGIVSGIAHSIANTLDVFFESFGIAAGVKVGTAFADDISKDGAWGSLRIESAAGKSLVDWETTRKSKWAPREFGNGEEGYKQYLNEISRGTVDALKGAASELPAWANRIISAADTSGDKVDEVLQKVLTDVAAFPTALLQSAGTSRDELVKLFADGLKNGDATAAGKNVADTLVAALEDTFYTQAAGKVFDIINMGIVTPMIDALLTGAALSDVMSQATMDAVIARATATATALNAVFNDPAFAQVMNSLRTGLSSALGSAGGAITYRPQYAMQGATEATGNLADATDKLTSAYESAISSLTSARDSMAVELLRVQGKEKEARQLERDQYMAQFTGLDAKRREEIETLYDANIATRDYIDGLKQAAQAQRTRLTDLRNSLTGEIDAASAGLDAAMAAFERTAGVERERLNGIITEVRGVFDAASNGAKALFGTVEEASKFQGRMGQDFITKALATAKATGLLPDSKALAEAISGATNGLGKEMFASQAEADYARLVLANELKGLGDISGDQLTEAERQLKKLDEQLQAARDHIDVMRGVKVDTSSMAASLAALVAAYNTEARTRADVAAKGLIGKDGAVYDLKTGEGLTSSGAYFQGDELRQAAIEALAQGATPESIHKAIKDSGFTIAQAEQIVGAVPGSLEQIARDLGLKVFHKGTNYVPQTGFALLEQGEAVIPAGQNPFRPGRQLLGGDTTVLVALLERLSGQMQGVHAAVGVGSAAALKTAELLASVKQGNGLVMTAQPVF